MNGQLLLGEQELLAPLTAAAVLKELHFTFVRSIVGKALGRQRVRRKQEEMMMRRRWWYWNKDKQHLYRHTSSSHRCRRSGISRDVPHRCHRAALMQRGPILSSRRCRQQQKGQRSVELVTTQGKLKTLSASASLHMSKHTLCICINTGSSSKRPAPFIRRLLRIHVLVWVCGIYARNATL